MSLELGAQSALDLHLKGSVGHFKVGCNSTESLEVKYFLSHVSLDLKSGGQNEKLLKQLSPVREIFNLNDQEFDEIMQRDIDDARVSNDLIPYILDSNKNGTIKFFPPIVIMCLPMEHDRNNPSDFYPEVEVKDVELNDAGAKDWKVTRSGDIGNEVFEFRQPIIDGTPLQHDLVKFSLNTSKTKMIIVDGQHRAMALLALYRNLKEDWNDAKRRPFQSYYSEWTPEHIREFNLDEIQLPIILCTVPSLDKKFNGDYDLKRAARSIFLTLNKNARPVTRTRNLLLDDSDMISYLMRNSLSYIKDSSMRSKSTLDIHCVELDQDGDKQKISNPIALTGVSHCYYIVEHLMLNNDDVTGISPRGGKFSLRTQNSKISKALDRLDCFEELGHESRQTIRRDFFTTEEMKILSQKYNARYGSYIVKAFKDFSLYVAHNDAAFELKLELENHQDVHLKPMLFEGQGMIRTFESHRENLKNKLKNNANYFGQDVPRIESIKRKLDGTRSLLDNAVIKFEQYRAQKLFSSLPKKQTENEGLIKTNLLKLSNSLFRDIYTSVAFQSALVCTFFDELEKVNDASYFESEDASSLFDSYLFTIGNFLKPSSISRLKIIYSLFKGKTTGDEIDDFETVEGSKDTFRNVVFPGEMQPDAWPVYKYLLLEIWSKDKSLSGDLKDSIDASIKQCRLQVFDNLFTREKSNYLKEELIREEDLEKEKRKEIKEACLLTYKSLLSNFDKSSQVSLSYFEDET